MKWWRALPGLAAMVATRASAQIDYRNLDDDRPVAVEDAYPLERYAFEWLGAYRFARLGEGSQHLFVPELAYGIARGTELGIKAPFAATTLGGSTEAGLAGLRVFALYNLTSERPSLPGAALRLDATAPLGSQGGRGAAVMVQALATRSFGRNRLHLNAGAALVRADEPAAAEGIPSWRTGLAVDRTLIRSSTLLLAAVTAEQETPGAQVGVAVAAGFRRQMAPALVLDAGASWTFRSSVPPRPALTVGLSHAFAIAGLMPGGAP
jgi:hypothetical protein